MTAHKSRLFDSISLKKTEGLQVKYTHEIDKKGTRDKADITRNAQPLPAWTDMWNKLKRPMVEATSAGALIDAKRSKVFLDAFASQEALDNAVNGALNGIKKRIRVTSLSLTWKDREELVGCVVSGAYTNEHGETMAVNTPYIHLNRDVYGFEADLHETIMELLPATEGYLDKGEYTQLDLFSGEENAEAKPGEQMSLVKKEKGEKPAKKKTEKKVAKGKKEKVAA